MQAYHKSQKALQIKKSKQAQQKQKQEKLARRNPLRIARQIEELKSLESERPLKTHEQKVLKELEGELAGVRRAREALGIQGDNEGVAKGRGAGGGGGVEEEEEEEEEVAVVVVVVVIVLEGREGEMRIWSNSVAEIPMPEGSPPRQIHALPPKPAAQAVTTYEAKPVVRDLRKEAAAFVPVAVKRRMVATPTPNPSAAAGEGGDREDEDEKGLRSGMEMGQINAAPEIGKTREADEEYERFRKEMEMEVEAGVGGGGQEEKGDI
ncbi:hypothetical protein EV426DRAFT_703549 [Tirmania nivea]|nr:hypothetical protein EV426DRAFT_703549 [Tirmania nivea]